MDLELALGRPIANMPERTFMCWWHYSLKKALPQRRIELYLAQIAMLIARMNGSDATLQDFLFDPPDDEPDLDALKAAFDFKPANQEANNG